MGTFEVTLDGISLAGFRSAKARALLAYLVVESGRPHRRAALEALFWGQYPERSAHQSLRQTLVNLRDLLAPLAPPAGWERGASRAAGLTITRHEVGFHLEPGQVWVDLHTFDQLLAAADSQHAGSEQPDLAGFLAQAMALYRGPFLAGLSLRDSPAFEEWRLLHQVQRHDAALAALERLAAHHLAAGHSDQAAQVARRQLALEPWSETANQSLMLALALEGQRGAALRQYEECRRVLAEELGAELSPETETLARQIREGKMPVPAGSKQGIETGIPGPPPRPHPVPPPFVARQQELARLDRFLVTTLAGHGQVVFVVGEAGSGKTALLAHFARRAVERHHKLLVAGGQSSAYAGLGDPLLPFREIVHTLCGEAEPGWVGDGAHAEHTRRLWAIFPHVVEALLDAGPDLIGRFVSPTLLATRAETLALPGAAWYRRLASLLGQLPPGASGSHGTDLVSPPQQITLFEQLTRVLFALARQQPLLLLIDNLHWADGMSLSLLFYLAQRIASSRILIVATYSTGEISLDPVGADSPLRSLVRECTRREGDVTVDLDRVAGRPFVDALLDHQPNHLDEIFRQTLTRHTGGHALFTVELLHAFRERGDLVRDQAGYWVEGPALRWEGLPPRVEAVIAEQVGRLPAEWRHVLEAASVEGESFSAEVVARALDVEPAWVLQGLSGRLSREHRLVEAVGVHYLGEGGEPLSRYRFRHGLFQEHLHDHLDAVQRARMHGAVGRALEELCGGVEAALAQVSPQLARHYEQAGKPVQAATFLLLAGRQAMLLAAYREAGALFQHGLALLAQAPASGEGVRLRLELTLALDVSLCLTHGWGAPERLEALAAAYRLAQSLGEPERVMRVLLTLIDVQGWHGQTEQALQRSEELLRRAEQVRDSFYLAAAHLELGMSHLYLGRFTASRAHLEQTLALAPQRQPARPPAVPALRYESRSASLAWLGLVLEMMGYADQALACHRQALAAAEELVDPLTVVHLLITAGIGFHALRREPAGVQAAAERLQAVAGQLASRQQPDLTTQLTLSHMQAWITCYLGWSQAMQGETDAGVRAMQAGLATLPEQGIHAFRPHLYCLLAEALLHASRPQAGLAALDELGPCRGLPYEAEVYRLRGKLLVTRSSQASSPASQQGDTDTAEACFEQALEAARRQEAHLFELRAAVSLARWWQSRGRRIEARQLLVDTYGWFTEGFDTPDLREARALLLQLA
ncbi:MAG: AAA family ATPase [Anaerolineae bacterium]|nr:AAA family ATPase [Anaerolineae bacterium]